VLCFEAQNPQWKSKRRPQVSDAEDRERTNFDSYGSPFFIQRIGDEPQGTRTSYRVLHCDANWVRLNISIAQYCERRRGVRTLANRTSTPEIFPRLDAIQNVFALALKRDPEIKHFNPLALWDLHYLREIDDSGYIDRLCR
jgi:hypothetical protein